MHTPQVFFPLSLKSHLDMLPSAPFKRKGRLAVFFLAAGCAFLLSKQFLLTTTSEATVLSRSGGSTRAALKIAEESFPSTKAIHEDEAVAQSAQAEAAVRSALALKQAEKAFPQEDEAKLKAQKAGSGEIGGHEFRALARSNSELSALKEDEDFLVQSFASRALALRQSALEKNKSNRVRIENLKGKGVPLGGNIAALESKEKQIQARLKKKRVIRYHRGIRLPHTLPHALPAAHAHRSVSGLRIPGYGAVPKQSLSFMQTWTHHDAQNPSEEQE